MVYTRWVYKHTHIKKSNRMSVCGRPETSGNEDKLLLRFSNSRAARITTLAKLYQTLAERSKFQFARLPWTGGPNGRAVFPLDWQVQCWQCVTVRFNGGCHWWGSAGETALVSRIGGIALARFRRKRSSCQSKLWRHGNLPLIPSLTTHLFHAELFSRP